MTKKKILMSLALLPMMSFAQKILVNNANVDLGQVMYRQPATAIYSMKNTSSSPITIKDVDTGCGCTIAEYPKGSIAPGAEFQMKITYDAMLLGHFNRLISVFDSTSDNPTELVISGNVVTEVENFSGSYPIALGDLLVDTNVLEFDDVHIGDKITQEIHFMNPTGQYVEPVVMHIPSYIRTEVVPAKVAPKKGGVIRFTMNSKNTNTMGLLQSTMYLGKNAGEKVSENKEINISAIILPEQMSKDDQAYSNSPRISLSTKSIDFSNFAGKAKKKADIVITNNGNSTLEIKKLQMFTMGLEVVLPKQTLKPGESTKMKVTGNAAMLEKVRQQPRLLMITNDPTMPKIIIEIKK